MGDRSGWGAYIAADTAVASSDLNALASGTAAANYKLGSGINNGGTASYYYGDLEIVFRDGTPADTTITTGSGAPFLDVYIIPSADGGTRYATTNGSTTAGPTASNFLARRFEPPASTALGIIIVPRLVLPAGYFKVMINNQLGVSFPSTNNSLCRLYRFGERGNLT